MLLEMLIVKYSNLSVLITKLEVLTASLLFNSASFCFGESQLLYETKPREDEAAQLLSDQSTCYVNDIIAVV